MKVVKIYQYGGREVLQFEEAQEPIPGPKEILIKIKAIGMNPIDWKTRQGYMKEKIKLPFTLGWDLAGIVEGLGEEVTKFQLDDEVYAMTELIKGGCNAEYVIVHENFVALKPKSLNFEEAAAVPLAALTAWQALFDVANLQANQKVLIHAGSGGVGSFAIQFAKEKGAFVTTTTSSNNIERVKKLGADEVLDYTHVDFVSHCKDSDVVLDTVGKEVQDRSFECLKPEGKLVTIVALNNPERGIRTLVEPNGARLAQIASLIDAGKIKPLIDRIMMFKELAAAHELSESGHAKGKIVLRVSK